MKPKSGILELLLILPPVTLEEEASFVTIIDSILAASDLNTISEKRIRKELQAAINRDLTSQKVRQCYQFTGLQFADEMTRNLSKRLS